MPATYKEHQVSFFHFEGAVSQVVLRLFTIVPYCNSY